MANPTSNFGWQMPTNTDLVKDLPADFEVFGQAVDTSLMDLKGGTTGQVLSKASNTDMDFTWVTSDDANAIQNTIVDAKGDLISASAADVPARLAVGNNGETLVADSSTSTGLRWQGNYAAGKNFVINGNMNIAQRGSTFTGATAEYTIDRLFARNSTTASMTVTKDTDGPAGFKSSAKFLYTTANSSLAASAVANAQIRFEGQMLQSLQKGTATARPTTLSFWVKSNLTGTYIVEFIDDDNTRIICGSYTINSSATWEKKTITISGDTTGSLDNDSSQSLRIVFWLAAGSDRTTGTLQTTWASSVTANEAVGQVNLAATANNYWMITGVQWEIGSVATDFQLSAGTLAGELQAAQRYYWRGTATNVYGALAAPAIAATTTAAAVLFRAPVTMRTSPSSVEYANLGLNDTNAVTALTNLTITRANPDFVDLTATVAAGLTQYRPYYLVGNNNANAYLGLSAEL